ncbi:hypothetical protein [Entomohabitans teleogrylli]|nr:hypothetical protein [Entomohabitans teleogrylli]
MSRNGWRSLTICMLVCLCFWGAVMMAFLPHLMEVTREGRTLLHW